MYDLEKIYLVDQSLALVQAWNQVFANYDLIETYQGDYFEIAADAMVSPANSFGIMDGGLDLAIRDELGFEVETQLQKVIVEKHHGELNVGCAEIIKTHHVKWSYLIAAPTMRVPQNIVGTLNAYLAFRAILLAIKLHNSSETNDKIKTLVCCGLGTGIGQLAPRQCAAQMRVAFNYVSKPARIPSFAEIHQVNLSLMMVG